MLHDLDFDHETPGQTQLAFDPPLPSYQSGSGADAQTLTADDQMLPATELGPGPESEAAAARPRPVLGEVQSVNGRLKMANLRARGSSKVIMTQSFGRLTALNQAEAAAHGPGAAPLMDSAGASCLCALM